MEKIKVLPSVFRFLFEEILLVYKKEIDIRKYEHIHATGPALFGFRDYSGIKNSIKGIMASHLDVKKSLSLTRDKAFEKINGKYLYDRLKEAKKEKLVQLTGIYAKIYFVFCGYENIQQFLKENDKLTSIEKQKQLLLLNPENAYISELGLMFIAHYFSYRENKIKRFVLEIDYLNAIQARQTGFHFAMPEDLFLGDKSSTIDVSKIYAGKGIDKESYLYLYLQGGKGNFMNIFLYKGGMQVQNMKLIRGTLTAMSAHGYIFTAEIFLKRITKKVLPSDLLLHYSEKYEDKDDLYLRRYLYLERRTLRIPRNTEQNIQNISAKRYSLKVIEPLIGIWKIWGVDYKGRIMQSKLKINEDYSAYLLTNSNEQDEEQVCIFRVSSYNGLNLWISAHQEHGIELKNIAVVKIPTKSDKVQDITTGVASGLGVRNNKYANTPIVLYKINNDDFHPTQLDREDLMKAMFSPKDNPEKHQKMYMRLEKLIFKSPKRDNKFMPYSKLVDSFNSSIKNLGSE